MRPTRPHVVVVGDAFLDRDVEGTVARLCPDAPAPVLDERRTTSRPGGAGLAAAAAAREGADVTLVTAMGDDAAGSLVRASLRRQGVEVVDLGLEGATPEKVRLRCGGTSLARLDRGGPPSPIRRRPGLGSLLPGADALLVSDYGRGLASVEELRADVASAGLPVVWDPHPRGSLPVPGSTVATPNLGELAAAAGHRDEADGATLPTIDGWARDLVARWEVGAVAATMGADGVLLARADTPPSVVPVPPARPGDACGAGDAFSSALAAALGRGDVLPDAVGHAAHAAARFVDAGGAAALADDARSSGRSDAEVNHPGVTVATGGCFDLLHAGHVSLLDAARRLGDRLVVLLNSDASVARLKGPGRPLQTAHDRREVLLALGSVDDVVIFDEDTPAAALGRLRPQVFVKGGDYVGRTLPEEEVLRQWGGAVVLVPYLSGRSTTSLVEEARRGG